MDLGTVVGGRLGAVILNLLFLPLYDALLGPHLFGAIAVILSLSSFFSVFDFGVATLVATDVAASREDNASLHAAGRDWRRSELILTVFALLGISGSLAIGSVGGFGIFGAVEFVLAGCLILVMMLINVAQAVINGLQAYRLNSAHMLAGAISRGLATVIVLQMFDPSLFNFLGIQCAIAFIHYMVLRGIIAPRLSVDMKAAYDRLLEYGAMRRLWVRMRPLMAYSLAGALVLQVDKPLVAYFFSLEMAGRWFLATTYALTPIVVLAGPLNQYFYPKLVAAISDPVVSLRTARWFQLSVSLAVTAPTIVLVVFADEVLGIWLPHSSDIAWIAPIAQVLIAAAAIGTSAYLPVAWIISSGDRLWIARLTAAGATAVIALLMLAGYWQSIMVAAAVYGLYYSFMCVMTWTRMLRSWPGKASGTELVITSWFAPVLIAGIPTALAAEAIRAVSMSEWLRVVSAGTAGLCITLLVAGLWWRIYSEPRAGGTAGH